MNNNKKIVMGLIVAILLIVVIVVVINKRNSNTAKKNVNTEINYNNETGEYYIQDENGEVIHSAYSEDDLYIYQIDPDYDAKNPDSSLESQAMPEE